MLRSGLSMLTRGCSFRRVPSSGCRCYGTSLPNSLGKLGHPFVKSGCVSRCFVGFKSSRSPFCQSLIYFFITWNRNILKRHIYSWNSKESLPGGWSRSAIPLRVSHSMAQVFTQKPLSLSRTLLRHQIPQHLAVGQRVFEWLRAFVRGHSFETLATPNAVTSRKLG